MLETLVRDVRLEDRAQVGVRDEVVGASQQAARARQRAQRKYVLPAQTEPDFLQLRHTIRLGPPGDPRSVDRSD